MATIKEIAQKTGVSIGTVDRVLHNRGKVNKQTQEKIFEVIEELNYKPNHVAQGLAVCKKKLKLGFILPELKGHPFFWDVKKAAVKKAKELEQYGVQVNFMECLFGYEEDDCRTKYLNMLDEVDGLAIVGVDTGMIRAVSKKADSLNIPVVFYNLLIPDEKFLAYVGPDYVKSGQLAAGLCALIGGKSAQICTYSESYAEVDINGNSHIIIHDERFSGFQQEIRKRYPDMGIADIRLISKSRKGNYHSAQEMLKRYPEVNVVYVLNPGDYNICEEINKADAEHRIKIITNDLVEGQKEMLEQEVIAATVCQEPEKQGAKPLDILFRYLAYGTVPKDKMYYTNLSIHIAQNI